MEGLRSAFSGMMSPMHLKDQMQFKLLPRNISYLRSSLVRRSISKVLGLLTVYGTRLFGSLLWTDAYSIGMLLCKLKEFPAIPNLDHFFIVDRMSLSQERNLKGLSSQDIKLF